MVQVFLSHTKLDVEVCDMFDSVAAREGVKVFRSEFEELESPPWQTIKKEVVNSAALFLLVGKELVYAQNRSEASLDEKEKWKYTQNWISYEIGVACQQGIDVWVVCNKVDINFPVPYLNNYDVNGLIAEGNFKYYRSVFKHYLNGNSFPYRSDTKRSFKCGHKGCGAKFNFRSQKKKGSIVICPSCLTRLKLIRDFG